MIAHTNPRIQAAEIIGEFNPLKQNLSSLLLSPKVSNKSAVRDYVLGVVKNKTAIDGVLAGISNVKSQRVDNRLLNALRIAVYELVYSPSTADYAIVNEAVNQFKSKAKRGFCNAVLRNIQRNMACRDDAYLLSEFFVPTSNGRGCRFYKAIAPNPSTNLLDYFQSVFSLPKWLLEGWCKIYGSQTLFDICAGSNRTARIYINPNRTITNAEHLHRLFTSAGIECEMVDGRFVVITNFKTADNVSSLPGYEEGLFFVQDITAAGACEFIQPRKDDVIIDLCAAPGTKTVQLASALEGGKVIATDIDSRRLGLVRENARRLGLNNIEVVAYEDIFGYAAKQPKIDAVLIDAPCSNSGVLAKRIEARFRITQSGIDELATKGYELLRKAVLDFKCCKSVFYSTCSIENKENTQVLHKLFNSFKTEYKSYERTVLPSCLNYGCDGGYIAKIEKK